MKLSELFKKIIVVIVVVSMATMLCHLVNGWAKNAFAKINIEEIFYRSLHGQGVEGDADVVLAQKLEGLKTLSPKSGVFMGITKIKDFELREILSPGIIRVFGEINQAMADSVIRQIRFFEATPEYDGIIFYINSPGGGFNALFRILAVIDECQKPVATVAINKAYSAAALLLMAGDFGRRYMKSGAKVYLHQLVLNMSNLTGYYRLTQAEEMLFYWRVGNFKQCALIARRSGFSLEQIQIMLEISDIELDYHQSIECGIVDGKWHK